MRNFPLFFLFFYLTKHIKCGIMSRRWPPGNAEFPQPDPIWLFFLVVWNLKIAIRIPKLDVWLTFIVNLLVFYLNKKWLTVSNYSDSIDKCLSASLLTFFRIFDIIIWGRQISFVFSYSHIKTNKYPQQ